MYRLSLFIDVLMHLDALTQTGIILTFGFAAFAGVVVWQNLKDD